MYVCMYRYRGMKGRTAHAQMYAHWVKSARAKVWKAERKRADVCTWG